MRVVLAIGQGQLDVKAQALERFYVLDLIVRVKPHSQACTPAMMADILVVPALSGAKVAQTACTSIVRHRIAVCEKQHLCWRVNNNGVKHCEPDASCVTLAAETGVAGACASAMRRILIKTVGPLTFTNFKEKKKNVKKGGRVSEGRPLF